VEVGVRGRDTAGRSFGRWVAVKNARGKKPDEEG
jgi:hypothetical protein